MAVGILLRFWPRVVIILGLFILGIFEVSESCPLCGSLFWLVPGSGCPGRGIERLFLRFLLVGQTLLINLGTTSGTNDYELFMADHHKIFVIIAERYTRSPKVSAHFNSLISPSPTVPVECALDELQLLLNSLFTARAALLSGRQEIWMIKN